MQNHMGTRIPIQLRCRLIREFGVRKSFLQEKPLEGVLKDEQGYPSGMRAFKPGSVTVWKGPEAKRKCFCEKKNHTSVSVDGKDKGLTF